MTALILALLALGLLLAGAVLLRSRRAIAHERRIARERSTRFQALVATIPDGVYAVDAGERITYMNDEAKRLLRRYNDHVGHRLDEILDPLASDVLPEIRRAQEHREASSRTAYFGATGWWIEIRVRPYDEQTVVYLRDVTKPKRAEMALLESEGRLRILMSQVPAVLWSVDREGTLVTVSGAGLGGDELRSRAVAGAPCGPLLGAPDAAPLEPVFRGLSVQFDARYGTRWLRHHVEPLRDEAGSVIGAAGASLDISEIKDAHHRLEATARRDPLTGLPNRRALEERLAALPVHGAAVLFVDLDRFKVINDTLGHHAGDEVLRIVAARLQSCLAADDVVARQGGDEFIVVLTSDHGAAQIAAVAAQIALVCAKPIVIDGRKLHITASVGAAIAPQHGRNAEELIRNADAAMYRAKADGGRRLAVYEMTMHAALDRLALEDDLRRALSSGEMRVCFQPIVAIESRRVTGCEALIRWTHPTHGELAPNIFVPIAEETGSIVELTRFVLAHACTLAAQMRARSSDFRITVNLSPRDLRESSIVNTVTAQLARSGLEPEALELEVTERALLDDAAVENVYALRRLGVRVAVDDFGIAYNSLLYIKRLPITSLKIDRAFVRNLVTDTHDQAIVAAIGALGASLGLHVIVEGIEYPEQLAFVEELGCAEAQGFLFSPAVESDAIPALLAGTAYGTAHPQNEIA